jgi:hypothetical protein
MPDRRGGLNLDVRGELDTSYPISDRPHGTLVEAKDLSPRFWGPRRGSQSFTRIWEGPGTASLYDLVTFNDSSGASTALGSGHDTQYIDLGTKFTIDLMFRLDGGLGSDFGMLYGFGNESYGYVTIFVRGDGQGTNVMCADLVTSPTRSTQASVVSLTGTTVVGAGTAAVNRQHVRLVRDGATLTLYYGGKVEATSSAVSATNSVYSPIGTIGYVWIMGSNAVVRAGSFTTVPVTGDMNCAILRDGAFTSEPIERVAPCAPWARNVHHYILGRDYKPAANMTDVHLFDAGRFGVHPKAVNSTRVSITSANLDDLPAPAFVQGMATWTTKSNKTATTVVAGGIFSTVVQA